MQLLDLGFGLILFGACGGKVVVDEQLAGTTGTSAGSGGSSSATSGTPSSSSSGIDCTALEKDYDAKVAAAEACSLTLQIVQCNGSATVPSVPSCCPTVVNETQPQLVQAAQAAYTAWQTAGCMTTPCAGACPAFMARCEPSPDGTTGTCVTSVK